MADSSPGATRPTWGDRLELATEEYGRLEGIPPMLRMDRAFKKAGVRDLVVENDQLQARIGVLLAFVRPVDLQAAERHIAEHGLVDASGESL